MVVVGLLHTSERHRSVFDDLAAEIDADSRTVTVVDEALLDRARRFGSTEPSLVAAVRSRLDELADSGARSILCTCSTIGAVAEAIGDTMAIDVVRVDRAMAEQAVATGGAVVVLATLDSTIEPTRDLIASVASDRGDRVDVTAELVPGAWERFRSGDVAGSHALVAEAIARVGDDAEVVVLAQASMAPAAELVDVEALVLSSPRPAMFELLRGGDVR
jgi:hypothetical protein